MNKTELVDKVSEKANVAKNVTEAVIDAALEICKAELKKNEEVRILKFGAFSIKERSERDVKNPKNPSELLHVPASRNVHYKMSKDFKAELNKKD